MTTSPHIAEGARQNEVCMTILKQLSPRGFNGMRAMVGLDHLVWVPSKGNGDGIEFRFKGCRRANRVVILLNEDDLYDLTFSKVLGGKITLVEGFAGVDCEQLRGIFEDTTGLRTGL